MDHSLNEHEKADVVATAVRAGIRNADPLHLGRRDWQPLAISARAADGTVVGGVYGATMWSWLMIDGLWVDESRRGHGLGSRLLLRSEAIAVARGCRGSWLGTFDFQARAFYERHGYTVFSELTDFPPGHTHYHLRKDLAPEGAAASRQR